MGNQPSNTSSQISNARSPLEYCDSVCQRDTRVKELWDQYQELRKQQKDMSKKVWDAKYNYYSTKDGPQWYTNYKSAELNKKLQNIRENKKKIINILVKTYNDKIILIYTQNNLINKQDRLLRRNNKNSAIQLNEISEMSELITTKNREVYFKELNYMLKSEKIRRLNIILIFLSVLLLALAVLYFFKGRNINFNISKYKNTNLYGYKS